MLLFRFLKETAATAPIFCRIWWQKPQTWAIKSLSYRYTWMNNNKWIEFMRYRETTDESGWAYSWKTAENKEHFSKSMWLSLPNNQIFWFCESLMSIVPLFIPSNHRLSFCYQQLEDAGVNAIWIRLIRLKSYALCNSKFLSSAMSSENDW